MLQTVSALMCQCRNYFETGYIDGTFRIAGNALEGVEGAHYVYISGSLYHDGVWEICDGYLTGREVDPFHDEEFDGRVWFLNPPPDFLAICKSVVEYEEKNPLSAVIRETFGGFSREWADKMMGRTGAEVFANRLTAYRRMFTEVR